MKAPTTTTTPPPPSAPAPRTRSNRDENRRARNNVSLPLSLAPASKLDDAPRPLLPPSPSVHASEARPAPFNREARTDGWAIGNHADRGGRQSLLEADYDGQRDGDDSSRCSRVLVTCQCQSGITLVWIGMRRADIFSSMGK